MLNSNITLNESIELLLQTKQEKIIIQILKTIQNSIKTSQDITVSLQNYKYYLGETAILFLSLGIQNGNINQSINSLVQILQQDIKTSEKLKDTVRYPIILLISLFVAVSMIFFYVIPSFEFVFTLLKDDIPFSTQSLLFVKEFIDSYFYLISLFILFIVLVIYKLYFRYKLFF
jgi:type II secretory pathway component PulF